MTRETLQLTPGSIQQTLNVYKPKYDQKMPLPFVVYSIQAAPDTKPSNIGEVIKKPNALKLEEGQYFNYMHILGYKDLGNMEVLVMHVNQEKKNADKKRYHLILSCTKDALEKAKNFVAEEDFSFESSLQTFIAGYFTTVE